MEITKEMQKLCEACILLEAYTETIRPAVEHIYQDVFTHYFPLNYIKDREGNPITDYKKNYTAAEYHEHDWEGYYKEVQLRLVEANLPPNKEGCCPLLEAEEALRRMQYEFNKTCTKNLPAGLFAVDDLEKASYKLQKEFLAINMRLVAPTLNLKKSAPNFNI